MEFVAIDTVETTSPEWLRLPADCRGHWLSLMSVCAQRENGGRFVDCADWTGRDWDRIAGLTKQALKKLERFGLVVWSGPDLLVEGYNVEREEAARRNRQQRKDAIARRWSRSEATPAKSHAKGDTARNTGTDTGNDSRSTARSTESDSRSTARNTEERRGEERRSSASRTSKPDKSSKGKKKKSENPIPFTVADLLQTLEANANGRIAIEQFRADPKRWATQLTKTIRELDAAGYDLDDVAAAARLIGQWRTARALNWVAQSGNLLGACKSARLSVQEDERRPQEITGLTP